MCLVSLSGRPLLGLYYLIPFIPYRTLRDRFFDYPLGENVLTFLVIAVIIGAIVHGKRPPRTKMYLTWLIFGVYLYISMWIGAALGNAPAPLWLSNENFVTWKDYMLIPLIFFAAGMVVEDRKAIRTVVILLAITLFLVDKSALAESLSHSWRVFDENKRTSGPLDYGPNQLAAFLAQFGMFFWGFLQFMKRIKVKLLCYGMVAFTMITTMYTFSRAAYAAVLASTLILALIKDRKLLVLVAVFLFTWQTIVPTAVTERVSMTKDANGQLEASAQERVDLWTQAEQMFLSSPIIGTGFATFEFGQHTANLKDTHNWYVKVLVETGLLGGAIALLLIAQMLGAGYRLFRRATDPLYRGLGLGLLLAVCSSIVANFFGDRWTYLEINGLLWVLVATALRAGELEQTAPAAGAEKVALPLPPHMAWR
jgi:O-antigen ligase